MGAEGVAPSCAIQYRHRMFVQELPALAADTLARALAGVTGLAWLDSDGSPVPDARYSFVAAAPVEVRRGPVHALALLDTLEPSPADADGCGAWDAGSVPHWIGYLAYDEPGVCFARYEAVFAIDHVACKTFVIGDSPEACARLVARAHLVALVAPPEPRARAAAMQAAAPAEHARAIGTALAAIGRGDLYQVNLARKFWASFAGSPLALALAMRRESPVPLGMFFDDGERAVVARSMERFLRWRCADRRLHTRPIKGTRARANRDAEEQRALVGDPKEHAEHAMIVDLMRNDLGRVAAIGSVEVVERFVVEPFARLHHLVSTIACTTRPEVTRGEILRATFPPGSVTGTPKVQAVETIRALEPCGRGIYTGAVGFVDRAGGLSLAVAIRTAVVEAGIASYFAGGGIVEASDVAREIEETDLKARVFTDAIRSLA